MHPAAWTPFRTRAASARGHPSPGKAHISTSQTQGAEAAPRTPLPHRYVRVWGWEVGDAAGQPEAERQGHDSVPAVSLGHVSHVQNPHPHRAGWGAPTTADRDSNRRGTQPLQGGCGREQKHRGASGQRGVSLGVWPAILSALCKHKQRWECVRQASAVKVPNEEGEPDDSKWWFLALRGQTPTGPR